MRARYSLAVDHLFRLGTLDSISEALEHMQDMLRLNRSDNMGVRDVVPAMMLRLDLDQECYDFVKWWATCDPDGTYDWGDMTLPYLDTHGADVFEDPKFLMQKFAQLNSLVAILLLKLKLIVDIRNIKVTRKIVLLRRVPPEIGVLMESAAVRSPLSAKFPGKPIESLSRTETKLLNQIHHLGAEVVNVNQNFMFYLFEPDEALLARPETYSIGSWEEMALAMQMSYAALWETEGVLQLLNDARACAALDSGEEVDDIIKVEKMSSEDGSHRTAEEVRASMSINRIWGYLGWAVENASYLGPWFDRPSERHVRENREAGAMAEEEDAESEMEFSDEDDD